MFAKSQLHNVKFTTLFTHPGANLDQTYCGGLDLYINYSILLILHSQLCCTGRQHPIPYTLATMKASAIHLISLPFGSAL